MGIHSDHAPKILSGRLNCKAIIIFIVVEELNVLSRKVAKGVHIPTRISDQLDFQLSYECDNMINSYDVKAAGLFHNTFNHLASLSTEKSEGGKSFLLVE